MAVTLLAMIVALVPAVPAQADELPHNFGIEAACQPGDNVPSSGHNDATGVHGPAIDCLAWYDIARGRTTTHFGTTEPVTRAQAVTFMARMVERVDGFQLPERNRGAFPDVGGNDELAVNIERFANFNPPVVEGFEDGTFGPSEPMRRDQFASVADRLFAHIASQIEEIADLPQADSPFPDVGTESPHYRPIGRIANVGVIEGREDGNYYPRNNVLRGQTASIMARMLGTLVYTGVVDRPADAPAGSVDGVVHDAEDVRPDETGDPLSDATVEVRGHGARDLDVDANGAFDVDLPPGEYLFTVNHPGFQRYAQHVQLSDDESVTLDFRMYRSGEVPDDSDATTTTSADVDTRDDFWVIPIYIGPEATDPIQERTRVFAHEADQIILERPDGVVLELGAAGTNDSWWSRHSDGTSNRTGPQSGEHVLYYHYDGHGDVDDGWYDLTAEFDDDGRLIAVNDTPYPAGG